MIKKLLKIQNFGPIGRGYDHNDGFIDFSKVMVLCGPQGAGKSCVAKLYSTFSWIEKLLCVVISVSNTLLATAVF